MKGRDHNPVLLANVVRDLGGVLACPVLPSPSGWQAELDRYAPGCGSPTHVHGTNGGTMRCGAQLTQMDGTTAPYFCAACDQQFKIQREQIQ